MVLRTAFFFAVLVPNSGTCNGRYISHLQSTSEALGSTQGVGLVPLGNWRSYRFAVLLMCLNAGLTALLRSGEAISPI